ncbi:uncharacterized protein [Argopecten irradians]|uniref:uncharacterized protein isoform X2 n=1 Tax=Argopecten irradians TaxID=31199 RepID=UPI00371C453D
MEVSAWLALLSCVFMIQGSSGFEHRRITKLAKMVGKRLAMRRDTQGLWTSTSPTNYPTNFPTSYPTHYPTVNTPSPNTPIDFYQQWAECPVMEEILQQYFQGFPDFIHPIDTMHVSPQEVHQVLSQSMYAFQQLHNVRVAMDLMTENMARLLLDKRVNCTATMYQRVFVHYMRSRLDTMMAAHDGSLKSQIEQVLHQSFPGDPIALNMATEFVWGVHHLIHESFIYILLNEEFESMGWFLQNYRWKMAFYMEQYWHGSSTLDDVINRMQNDFFANETVHYPEVFQCTSPHQFIQIHRQAANWSSTYYWQAHKSGLALAFLTHYMQEAFSRNPNTAAQDPVFINGVIQSISNVIFQYVNTTMEDLSRYEGYLASSTLYPPTFMTNSLTPMQWNFTMMLFNRMFPNSPTVNPPTEFWPNSRRLVHLPMASLP